MSAKEQAIDLVEKFRVRDGYNIPEFLAKACAIICCDEIIATLKWNETKKENHWQEVKKQIELL